MRTLGEQMEQMAIIEADRVDRHLEEAVWWFKSWERNEVPESSYDQYHILHYLDLAIAELRRSDARDAAIPPLPPFRLDNPPLFGPPELEWAYGEVQDGRGWSPTNLEPSQRLQDSPDERAPSSLAESRLGKIDSVTDRRIQRPVALNRI